MILWIILAIVALTFFYKSIKQKQSYWQEKRIKYIEPIFLFGTTMFLQRKQMAIVLQEHYNKFPNERYYGIYNFFEPTLIVKDPELIKQITIKHFDHFADHRTFADYETDKFWGKNLLTSCGQRWKEMRAALSPSFTGSKMRLMFALMDECAQQFINFYKNDSKDVIEMDIKDSFSKYTNDVIATCAFGIQCNSLENPTNEFYLAGKAATNMEMFRVLIYMVNPTLSKLLKIKFIPPKIEKYFTKIIEESLRVRKENNIQRPDMIHLLMEAQKDNKKGEVTVEDITSHAFFFFFAGFETVSLFLSFFFYEVALQPEIQKRLRKEIESVEEKITYDSLLHLKYLDMVSAEILRKWPASFMERIVTREFTIEPEQPDEKPLVLEKGIDCMMPVYAIHRDSKYFPDPEKFDPERFSDENKHKINQAAYLPFGAGPRICIGNRFALMEGKLMIYHILKNFEVVVTEKTQIPVVLDPKPTILSPKGGMWLGLKPLPLK